MSVTTRHCEASAVRLLPAGVAHRSALAALAGDPGAKVLAGGQSLVPLLSMRLAAPAHARRHQRRRPAWTTSSADDDGVRIGALARHADVLASPTTYAGCSRWSRWRCAHVAHATIRNRGTTVGSLVHADAAAEMPVVLALLGGSLDVAGAGRRPHDPGRRALHSARSSRALHHDEIAVAAFFPALAAGRRSAFEEIARRHGDYALVRRRRRAGRRRRASRSATCPVWPTSRRCVDLTGVADERPRGRRGAGDARSTRATTSTPPRDYRAPAGARADRTGARRRSARARRRQAA